MTYETYDELALYIGKDRLPNSLWVDLIAEHFGVTRSVAKEMLHAMYVMRSIKKREEAYER